MKVEQEVDTNALNKLIDEDISFAIYRLPDDTTIHFILQNNHSSNRIKNIADIGKEAGFVICPFIPAESMPIVLIRPDIHLKGMEQVYRYINEFLPEPKTAEKESNIVVPPENNFEIYKRNFQTFHAALENKTLEKIVLSRNAEYKYDEHFSVEQTFRQAVEKYPNAFVYLCHTPQSGTWLGCSPELLLSFKDGQGHTVALAGTKHVQKEDAKWDDKNLHEQEVVSKYIRQQLKNQNIHFAESTVHSVIAGNVAHLKTEFNFHLSSQNEMGKLLQALHPTPAVCGFPKEKALDFIAANEGYDRRYYAGFVGMVNIDDHTSLYVNLRCMEVLANSLKLYAGGGLLATSDLETEWQETGYKLQTILSIINEKVN